jgi:hypothetical protein
MSSYQHSESPMITEPLIVNDVFASDIIEVEQIAGMVRMIFAVRCREGGGLVEHRIVARIVVPQDKLAFALQQLVDAKGSAIFPREWVAALTGAVAN